MCLDNSLHPGTNTAGVLRRRATHAPCRCAGTGGTRPWAGARQSAGRGTSSSRPRRTRRRCSGCGATPAATWRTGGIVATAKTPLSPLSRIPSSASFHAAVWAGAQHPSAQAPNQGNEAAPPPHLMVVALGPLPREQKRTHPATPKAPPHLVVVAPHERAAPRQVVGQAQRVVHPRVGAHGAVVAAVLDRQACKGTCPPHASTSASRAATAHTHPGVEHTPPNDSATALTDPGAGKACEHKAHTQAQAHITLCDPNRCRSAPPYTSYTSQSLQSSSPPGTRPPLTRPASSTAAARAAHAHRRLLPVGRASSSLLASPTRPRPPGAVAPRPQPRRTEQHARQHVGVPGVQRVGRHGVAEHRHRRALAARAVRALDVLALEHLLAHALPAATAAPARVRHNVSSLPTSRWSFGAACGGVGRRRRRKPPVGAPQASLLT